MTPKSQLRNVYGAKSKMKLFLALVSMFSLTLVTPRDGHVNREGETGQEICDNGQVLLEQRESEIIVDMP